MDKKIFSDSLNRMSFLTNILPFGTMLCFRGFRSEIKSNSHKDINAGA